MADQLNIALIRMASRYEPLDNTMTIQASVGQGTPVKVHGRKTHTLFVSGITDAALQVMGSIDNINFLPVDGASYTKDGIYTIKGSFESIRIDTTAYTSGTPAITIRSQL